MTWGNNVSVGVDVFAIVSNNGSKTKEPSSHSHPLLSPIVDDEMVIMLV